MKKSKINLEKGQKIIKLIPEPVISKYKARQILEKIFLRNGYLRLRNEEKLKLYGSQKYKKGFEIRLMPIDYEELKIIRISISTLGFTLSNTFVKNGRIVQPLYGKEMTLYFKKIMEKNKSRKFTNAS